MKTPHCFVWIITVGILAGTGVAEDAVGKKPAAHAPESSDVGVSSHDGLTISTGEVLVTRNRLTEKLQKEMELSNGLRVKPDGTLIAKDGTKTALRPTQLLTFDGRIIEYPISKAAAPKRAASVPPVTPTGKAVHYETPRPATPKPHIKAGEGVQK